MRAIDHDHKGHGRGPSIASVRLAHDERAVRRRLLTLPGGGEVLVDLPHTVALQSGDVLVLEDGRTVEVIAAQEDLLEITARDTRHMMELCWHIGNRHLPAQIDPGKDGAPWRILVARDHVIAGMLEGLGASLRAVSEPFSPLRGAYAGDGHPHEGGHGHHHHHAHD